MSKNRFSEDLAAIFVGSIILIVSLITFVLIPSVSTTGAETILSTFLNQSVTKLTSWDMNPLNTFYGKGKTITDYLLSLGSLFLVLAVLFGTMVKLLGESASKFIKGFLLVFLVGLIAYVLAAQIHFKAIGLGYALWAIVLGMVISNSFGIPDWLRGALKHELFIKAGLVLLGAEVLFGKILAIGVPGLFVAWVVTPIVLVSTFWFGQRILKISSKTLNITISADMSVCGVSAAIATAAACKAKKEELTTAIGLSMVFTSVMMVALPAFIKAVGMPEVLGGAWLGGTIDATGAVVAAGAFLGDKALNVAATIKMIQNILIGVIAFAIAVYWTARVDQTPGKTVSASEIWLRFPKFILGFVGASLLFSFLHQYLQADVASELIEKGVYSYTKNMRGWLFCLAFTSIGLSTNFKELRAQFSGGKPLILYVCGQLLNLILTLFMAWLMFYVVFPEITSAI